MSSLGKGRKLRVASARKAIKAPRSMPVPRTPKTMPASRAKSTVRTSNSALSRKKREPRRIPGRLRTSISAKPRTGRALKARRSMPVQRTRRTMPAAKVPTKSRVAKRMGVIRKKRA